MTPDRLATAVQLALYRVADRKAKSFPHNEELIDALKDVAAEIGSILADRPSQSQETVK